MSTPAVVWMVVGLLTLTVTAAMAIALVRHLFVLGRAVGRLADEVGSLAREVGGEADRATRRIGRVPVAGRR
jgi:hypothetical protein